MDLTHSYRECIPTPVLERYSFAETRNATRILQSTNPTAFDQLLDALAEFQLSTADLITPGGQESGLAARLNAAFRTRGWREAKVDTLIRLSLSLTPFTVEEQASLVPVVTETVNEGYKVDNFRDRIALDVEWNATDGNLDRDLSAYRSLYDAGLIDAGVIISRTLDLRSLATRVGLQAGLPAETARRLLNTTTTTNDAKLRPRLMRGDAGGCPVLAVFISTATFAEIS